VPSKGALRTLRHIALGTSCTVAFGAGLITEDRRRRIHTAREASENARLLKKSRKYHSAGPSVAATFEEQVENYCKYGPWKEGDKQRILDPDWDGAPPSGVSSKQTSHLEAEAGLDASGSTPTTPRQFGRIDVAKVINWKLWDPVVDPKVSEVTDSILWNPEESPKVDGVKDSVLWEPTGSAKIGEVRPVRSIRPARSVRSARSIRPGQYIPQIDEHIRQFEFLNEGKSSRKMDKKIPSQTQLATQMSTLLRNPGGTGATRIMEAVSAFHRVFQGDILGQAVNHGLLDACILLAQECDYYDKMDVFIPVLSKILSCGHPIDEESLYKLHASKAIARLLEQSGYRHADHQVVTSVDKLKHAVAIFIVKTCEKPKPLPMELRDVGLQLCTATLRADLYELTEAVYWRLLCARTDGTASELECLILAEHRRAFWDQVLHHFSKYFSRSVPNQNQLYTVVSAAIDSALELGRIDKAEEVLLTASQMARNGNLRTSTKWHLRVLGEHWRTTRDIGTTQALFDRLEVFIEQTSHPQAMYSAIIQFCIEAGSESEARQYLERLTQLGDGNNIDIRTCGHLALAKAMKNDWAGVKADFCLMKKFAKGSIREHSGVFVPILKLFVASHDVGQVEDFVRLYLETLGVVPNQYIFNIMVDTYCKAGELSKIPQWIEYVREHGLQIDAVTFNIILSRCRRQWAAHPDDLFQLYKETKEKIGTIFDSTTIQILRRAAISSATPRRAASLLRQVKPPTGVPNCEKIESEMCRAFGQGNDTKVLKSYKFAMRTGKRVSRQGFSIAVKASIRSAVDGNLNSAIKLITEARCRGFDILPSMAHLLLHQVNTSNCNGDDFVSLVKHTLAEFDKRGLPITIFVASKVVGELNDRGRPQEAVMLWNTLASHDHIARQPMDLVLLTVLLRSYIMLSDVAGIRWAMTVVVENNIIPDTHFKQVVKNAKREARRFLDAQPDNFDAKQRYEVLDESVRLVVAQRLNGETKRKEAKQLTLSIVETALAAKPDSIQGESRQSSSEALHIKRSQRLRNPNEVWRRLGKYGNFGKRLGMTNMVESKQDDRRHHPRNASLMVREEEAGTAVGHEVTKREVLQEKQAIDVDRMVASPLKTKQAFSRRTEFDNKHCGGYHETSAQIVEVASS
jgi:pentatricopeptide repeat protein